MFARLGPLLLLFLLGLLFFVQLVLHPDQVLYSDHSDILAEHLPAKHFLVRSFQETGELPLWCPYNYGGMPFIHDPQVAAFYPPHFILYFLPENWIGPVLSWLVVAHVILAGWGMYFYARSQGLETTGALVAALGFMFSGKWLLHILAGGHYITLGLAWLPWLLLVFAAALRSRSVFLATWGGVIFGLMILGTQPQWTLYAGLLVALWTFGLARRASEGDFDPPSLARPANLIGLIWWAVLGMWMVVVGVGLSAIQLLPTMEAASQSSRAGGVNAELILAAAKYSLFNLVGPIWSAEPTQANLAWEERGGLDPLWIALAIMAPCLRNGRVRYQALVCLGLFVFAIGGSVAFQWLPGFNLFRQPSRMFMIVVFPVAYLAGITTDVILAIPGPSRETSRMCRRILIMVLIALAILSGSFAFQLWRQGEKLSLHNYWVILTLITAPGLCYLLGGKRSPWIPGFKVFLWLLFLVADLWALTWPVVQVRPEDEIYSPSEIVYFLRRHRGEGRVLDRDMRGGKDGEDSTNTPLGPGAPLAMLNQIEPLRGYTPLDNLRYKEYLQFIGDADEPLRSLESHLTFPVIRNFPIKNKDLLDLLGTRYLLQPNDVPSFPGRWTKVAEDRHPRAFDFIAGGIKSMTAYTVYNNPDAFPRAFVVPEAAALPPRTQVLEALKATDFRRRVLLDPAPEGPSGTGATRPATVAIRENLPNRLVVDVDSAEPSYLVLNDVWFPGWTVSVKGEKATLYRANYLFRAVAIPTGKSEVVFAFQPASYYLGRKISLGTIGLVALVSLISLARGKKGRRTNDQ